MQSSWLGFLQQLGVEASGDNDMSWSRNCANCIRRAVTLISGSSKSVCRTELANLALGKETVESWHPEIAHSTGQLGAANIKK